MKILIIEDEALAAKNLVSLLNRLNSTAIILDVLSSVGSAHKWFATHELPDLVLSDIQLSDGNSFEIFESMHLHCPVIFTTAYDEFAIRAFKLNSIDYLLKPIDVDELDRALQKYQSIVSGNVLTEQLKNLMGQWGNVQKKYKERFLAMHRNALVPVLQDDIFFFQKEELIYINTAQHEKFISEHQTLDEIESLLNPEKFFRVNRQFIIHVQSVSRIKTTHKGLTVILKAPYNTEIDISREKAVAFKKWVG
ncbi:MAG: response regulator transcription factor [Cyclobacteriaceae bacterium]|nr:response regulator transcription factor [Cyclobacteriaceae bacterium]